MQYAPVSLLSPLTSTEAGVFRLTEAQWEQLDMLSILRLLKVKGAKENALKELFAQPSTDIPVLEYRLDVTEDLLAYDQLVTCFSALIPDISELTESTVMRSPETDDLMKVVWRFRELEMYVNCMSALREAFSSIPEGVLRSDGLLKLRQRLSEEMQSDSFIRLEQEVSRLKPGLDRMSSVTIGINLNGQLEPVQATLLSVNEERFEDGSSMVSKMLSLMNWSSGLSTMHSHPDFIKDNSVLSKDLNGLRAIMFRDLKRVLKDVLRPFEKLLADYTRLKTEWLGPLKDELTFYLAAVGYVKRLRETGMPICRPKLLPMEHRTCRIQGLYNPALAIRMASSQGSGLNDKTSNIITNDISFDDEGRLYLLTGPNSGGKTTYAQAIGQIQALAQIGMYVPCTEAVLSVTDGIYTQFYVEELPFMESGKLGIESGGIREMFTKVTRHSLILLNETFSSTSPGESLYLMKDLVIAFRMVGVRGVITTHLHELAACAQSMNDETPGDSTIVSLVSGVVRESDWNEPGTDPTEAYHKRSYKIIPGPPQGLSYARDIAGKYGISLEQLKGLLTERNVISG